jgi:hypothetical protein
LTTLTQVAIVVTFLWVSLKYQYSTLKLQRVVSGSTAKLLGQLFFFAGNEFEEIMYRPSVLKGPGFSTGLALTSCAFGFKVLPSTARFQAPAGAAAGPKKS